MQRCTTGGGNNNSTSRGNMGRRVVVRLILLTTTLATASWLLQTRSYYYGYYYWSEEERQQPYYYPTTGAAPVSSSSTHLIVSAKKSTTSTSGSSKNNNSNVASVGAPPERKSNIANSTTTAYDESATTTTATIHIDDCRGKEKWIRILFGGTSNDNRTWTSPSMQRVCKSLPSEEQIAHLYGSGGPVVLGMDTCRQYRSIVAQTFASRDDDEANPRNGTYNNPQQQQQEYRHFRYAKPRVAGLYNSGTNAMERSMALNFHGQLVDPGLLFRVPWGKHLPPSEYRLTNTYPRRPSKAGEENEREDPRTVLPVVLVRDPYRWMRSMCKNPYDVRLYRPTECPRLVFGSDDENDTGTNSSTGWRYNNVTVNGEQSYYRHADQYKSLADMWSEWNRQYLEADFPRLVVRFEDTLYHAEAVFDKIRECIGMTSTSSQQQQLQQPQKYATPPSSFRYYFAPAKEVDRAESTDFASAMIRYATEEGRYGGMTKQDLAYAYRALDSELMNLFRYKYAPVLDDGDDYNRRVGIIDDETSKRVVLPLELLSRRRRHRSGTLESTKNANVKVRATTGQNQ